MCAEGWRGTRRISPLRRCSTCLPPFLELVVLSRRENCRDKKQPSLDRLRCAQWYHGLTRYHVSACFPGRSGEDLRLEKTLIESILDECFQKSVQWIKIPRGTEALSPIEAQVKGNVARPSPRWKARDRVDDKPALNPDQSTTIRGRTKSSGK